MRPRPRPPPGTTIVRFDREKRDGAGRWARGAGDERGAERATVSDSWAETHHWARRVKDERQRGSTEHRIETPPPPPRGAGGRVANKWPSTVSFGTSPSRDSRASIMPLRVLSSSFAWSATGFPESKDLGACFPGWAADARRGAKVRSERRTVGGRRDGRGSREVLRRGVIMVVATGEGCQRGEMN